MLQFCGDSESDLDVIESLRKVFLAHSFIFHIVAVEDWPGHIDPFVSDVAAFEAFLYAILIHDGEEVLQTLLRQQAIAFIVGIWEGLVDLSLEIIARLVSVLLFGLC